MDVDVELYREMTVLCRKTGRTLVERYLLLSTLLAVLQPTDLHLTYESLHEGFARSRPGAPALGHDDPHLAALRRKAWRSGRTKASDEMGWRGEGTRENRETTCRNERDDAVNWLGEKRHGMMESSLFGMKDAGVSMLSAGC